MALYELCNLVRVAVADLPNFKRICSLAVPVMCIRLLMILNTIIGVFFVSFLGRKYLSASALIISSLMLVSVTSMSIFYSVGVIAGNEYAKGNYRSIGLILRQSFILIILISIPVMLVLWQMSDILIYLGQPKDLCAITGSYFRATVWRIPASLGIVCFTQFSLAVLEQKFILVVNIIGFLLLAGFNYILIFGKLGIPKMGVVGWGYAYVLKNWIILGFMIAYYIFNKRFIKYRLFDLNFFSSKGLVYFKTILVIGWPIVFQTFIELIAPFVITLIVGILGGFALLSNQIVNQYSYLIMVPIFAVAQSGGILISHNFGAKEYEELFKIGNLNIIFGVMIALIFLLLFVFLRDFMIAAFLHNDLISYKKTHILGLALILMAIGQNFDSIRNVATGNLRGLHDTRYPMVISFLSIWIITMPLCYVLSFLMKFDFIGIVLAIDAGFLVSAILILFRWRWQTRQLQSFGKINVP